MEQFVLVPASVYKKCLNTPGSYNAGSSKKIKLHRIPRTKMIHLRKEINKKLITTADSLVDETKFYLVHVSSSEIRKL